MNVRTALLYRKNLTTLVDESVRAGDIGVFLGKKLTHLVHK
jgi:hypothetical protein